jgi:hypothetical protein
MCVSQQIEMIKFIVAMCVSQQIEMIKIIVAICVSQQIEMIKFISYLRRHAIQQIGDFSKIA